MDSYTIWKLEAQEQFAHNAQIGFLQTTPKSNKNVKNSKTIWRIEEQHGNKKNTKIKMKEDT